MIMKMKLGALLLVAGLVAVPAAVRADDPKVVLELFTSQGCSSCPVGRCLSRGAGGDAGRCGRALVPRRLLGLHRLGGSLRDRGDDGTAARLRACARYRLRLHAAARDRRRASRGRVQQTGRDRRHRRVEVREGEAGPRGAHVGRPRPTNRRDRTLRRTTTGTPRSGSFPSIESTRPRSMPARTGDARCPTITWCAISAPSGAGPVAP